MANALILVDENLTVKIWDSGSESSDPVILQPSHPGGYPFASAEAARSWAESYAKLIGLQLPEAPVEKIPAEEPAPEAPVEEPVVEAPVEETPAE